MMGKNKNTMSAGVRTKVTTVLGAGTVFDGNFKASNTVRVDGTVNGNCTSEEELILGPEGVVKGNVSARNLIISGRVDGDIACLGKLEILSTGKVNGNISARALVIDEGASFDGKCTMTSDGAVLERKAVMSDEAATERKVVTPNEAMTERKAVTPKEAMAERKKIMFDED